MQKEDFFREIEHVQVPWGERVFWIPEFYQDVMSLGVVTLASLKKLRALMPSPRMHPIRITPWHGVLSVSAYENRECDIGPYNEVMISIPFTLDKPKPIVTGLIRPVEPSVYVHQMPVTTEIARASGVEFVGYPKFLARIEFELGGEWVTCRAVEGERHILTLAGRKLNTRDAPRSRTHIFTVRNGRLLRSEANASERPLARTRTSAHARLELGDHPVAQELQALGIGQVLEYEYIPRYQAVVTPVIESFAL